MTNLNTPATNSFVTPPMHPIMDPVKDDSPNGDAVEVNPSVPGASRKPDADEVDPLEPSASKKRKADKVEPHITEASHKHNADGADPLGADEPRKRTRPRVAEVQPHVVTEASRKRKSDEAFAKKADNRAVLADTLVLCKNYGFEAKRVHAWILYATQERIQPDVQARYPQVQVRNADCVKVATELAKDPEAKVWMLNMASAKTPGGGVRNGANAQEEHLCRCSDLLPQLERGASEGNYPLQNYANPGADTHWFSVLVHREVTFFKDPENYSLLPREDWSNVGVLTAAAENMKRTAQVGPNALRFIGCLLDAAEAQGCTHLVLSAWGCGAYRQSAAEVARCFRMAIKRVKNTILKEVVFAIIDDHNSVEHGGGNLNIFRTEFFDDGPEI